MQRKCRFIQLSDWLETDKFRWTHHAKMLHTFLTFVGTHSTERPHQCMICRKWYKTSGVLKAHMRIHSDDMPHECQLCQKQFKTAGRSSSCSLIFLLLPAAPCSPTKKFNYFLIRFAQPKVNHLAVYYSLCNKKNFFVIIVYCNRVWSIRQWE